LNGAGPIENSGYGGFSGTPGRPGFGGWSDGDLEHYLD